VPGPALLPADSQLTYTGDVNGAQRWISADLSVVQYRAAGRLLTFHAWKRSHLVYWSMGASVTADGENWDAAIIDSNYYMTVPERPPCDIVKVGQSTSRNNSYFDWPSGTFTAPAHGGLPITVTFEGGDAAGSYRTSVRIVVGQGTEFTVPVTVALSASGPVK
jgi:hypothetical protein